MNDSQLKEIHSIIKYTFNNPELLLTALTHSSYANENKKDGYISNERLEFFGDSILGFTVAELIYKHNSGVPEGQMTKLRAELVCEKNLAILADTLGLGNYLLLGRGEEKGGGKSRPSILADAVEAIIAAIYLDSGIEAVMSFVKTFLFSGSSAFDLETTDYKTTLQELVQEKPGQFLSYHVINESGPDHDKEFTVEVRLNNSFYGQGVGKSKKSAEQAAARSALNVNRTAI